MRRPLVAISGGFLFVMCLLLAGGLETRTFGSSSQGPRLPPPRDAIAIEVPAEVPDQEPTPVGEGVSGDRPSTWVTPRSHLRSVKVRQQPAVSAAILGEVRAGDEAQLYQALDQACVPGPGCACWLKTSPVGYLCRDQVRVVGQGARTSAPGYQYAVVKSVRAPLLSREAGLRPQPKKWLRRGDGVTVVGAPPFVGRSTLLRTASHGYMWWHDLALTPPSSLRATDVAALPPDARYALAWIVPPMEKDTAPFYYRGPHAPVAAVGPAAAAGAEPRVLPRYTQVLVVGPGVTRGRVGVRLLAGDGDVGEIDADHLRRLLPPPLPPDLTPTERWIDVSLSQQVAAAYDGPLPRFATLVSTSARATPPGTFYIYRKYRTQTLANLAGSSSVYNYREVPFAQFFFGRFGFHAALWHDHLGHPVSHGCVNLSPADAERFFSFTTPGLPEGWHSIIAPPRQGAPMEPSGTRIVIRR